MQENECLSEKADRIPYITKQVGKARSRSVGNSDLKPNMMVLGTVVPGTLLKQFLTWQVRAGCIAGLSALVYGFTLRGDFVFDDSEAILKNPDVTATGSLSELFVHDFWGSNITNEYSHKSYRPLTILSYRLNYYLNQNIDNAYEFKLTNLVLHIFCTLLVWRGYELLIPDTGGWSDVGFLSALLFAVHPVHVEAVAGAVGRADVLAAIFYFLAFISYVKAARAKKSAKSYFYLIATAVFSALSMLSKEIGVTVLGLCISYEITYIRKLDLLKRINYIIWKSRKKLKPLKGQKESLMRIIFVTVATMVLLVFRWAIMGNSRPNFQPTDNPAAFSDDWSVRLLTYHYIYCLNGLLLVWPQWLCFDWSMGCVPLVEDLFDPRMLLVGVFYSYVAISLLHLSKATVPFEKKRLLVMSCAMMVIPFLPASNVFFTVGFVVAERLLYIPSAGFCVLVGIGLKKLAKRRQEQYSKFFYTLYCLLLLTFSLRSYERSRNWQTEYDLFTSGLEVCPDNAKVHYNVAKVEDARHQTDRAIDEYKQAIRLYPKYYQAMNNLANLLKDQRKFTEAENYLRQAIKYKRDFPAAWMNLAIVLANTKRLEESREAYQTALTYRQSYPDCYYNLGNLYLEMKLEDRAVESWNEAISLNPRHRLAWSNLLALLDNTGQTQRALDLIPTALSELPDSHSIHFIVANILGKIGHFEQAEMHFLRTIELSKKNVQAIHYANLGVLYHRWKKYVKAEAMYQKALDLNPSFKSASDNIKTVRKLMLKQNEKLKTYNIT